MTAVLEVSGLTMRFGAVAAAQEIDLTVDAGSLVSVIGPNGAGKTTFLNLITGYLKPQAGSIRVLGNDIAGLHPQEVTLLGVGRSFQTPQLFVGLSVLQNTMVALATAEGRSLDWWSRLASPERGELAMGILKQFGLERLSDQKASEIAEGARKLLDVVLAFALDPKLLLLDEPTSGVSVEEKFVVMDTLTAALRKADITAIFVEHDMEVVRRFADRVLVLSEGRIVADGPPDEVLGDEETRRLVAGWH